MLKMTVLCFDGERRKKNKTNSPTVSNTRVRVVQTFNTTSTSENWEVEEKLKAAIPPQPSHKMMCL